MDPRIIPFGWGLLSDGKEEEVIVIEREEDEEEEEEEEDEEEEEEEDEEEEKEEEDERGRENVLPSLLCSLREARSSGELIIYILL